MMTSPCRALKPSSTRPPTSVHVGTQTTRPSHSAAMSSVLNVRCPRLTGAKSLLISDASGCRGCRASRSSNSASVARSKACQVRHGCQRGCAARQRCAGRATGVRADLGGGGDARASGRTPPCPASQLRVRARGGGRHGRVRSAGSPAALSAGRPLADRPRAAARELRRHARTRTRRRSRATRFEEEGALCAAVPDGMERARPHTDRSNERACAAAIVYVNASRQRATTATATRPPG